MERYEVLTYMICEGWINCWTITDEKGNSQPVTFSTIENAQAEIDEFFKDIQDAVLSGNMEDDCYDREDYRIYDREKKEYVT